MEGGLNYIASGDSSSEEVLVSFTLEPPTLQSIASVAIVTEMWGEAEMLKEFCEKCSDTYDPESNKDYLELEKRILKKITDKLPNLLQSTVSSFVRPLGIELLKWFRKTTLNNIIPFSDVGQAGGAICWTMEGTTNKVKSLENLINTEYPEKDYCTLYALACKYCLEKYIFDLWNKIPSERKEEFDFIYNSCNFNECDDYALAYWTFTVKNERDIMLDNDIYKFDWHYNHEDNHDNSILTLEPPDFATYHRTSIGREDKKDTLAVLKNMIWCSILQCNTMALKYFWQKFVEKIEIEKSTSQGKWLERVATELALKLGDYNLSDFQFHEYILKFLLFHVKDPDDQKDIARKNSRSFLRHMFKSWSHRRFYKTSPLLPLLLNSISENDYARVMNEIIEDIEEDMSGEIFGEVWRVTPKHLKHVLFESNECCFLLLCLTASRYLDIALIVVKDMSLAVKQRSLSLMIESFHLGQYIFLKNDLDSLDILFKELLSPDIESIKQNIITKLNQEWCKHACCKWLCEGDIEYTEKFLKWAFKSKVEIESYKLSLPANRIYVSIISSGNYDHVHQFVNWYFIQEKKFEEVRNILLDEENLKLLLNEFGYQRNRSKELFDKFTKYCISFFEEISKLKTLFLKHLNYVVNKKYLELASAILNWCFDDKDEIDEFKTNLVISESGFRSDPPYDCFMLSGMVKFLISSQDLMVWALPLSRKIISELKSSLNCNDHFYDTNGDLIVIRQLLFRLLYCENLFEFKKVLDEYDIF